MKSSTTTSTPVQCVPVGKALEEVSASFDRFCLAAGLEALSAMMERDAAEACGLELPTDFKNLPGQLFGEKLSRLNHL